MDTDQAYVTEDEIEKLVHRLAYEQHLADPQVCWEARCGGGYSRVEVLSTPPRIHVASPVLAHPGRARATVAHEIGHLMDLGDGAEMRAHRRQAGLAWTVQMVAIVAFCVVAFLNFVGLIPFGVVVAALLAALLVVLAAMRWLGLRHRRFEIAADLHGADLGYPFTPDQFTDQELHPGLGARIGYWADASHPLWPDRLDCIAAHEPRMV